MHLFLRRKCGNSSVGRARPCQGRGREFESRFPLTNDFFVYNGCPDGGIGRHTSLRGWRRLRCASSNLVPGTNKNANLLKIKG